jgi:hypothetical protein
MEQDGCHHCLIWWMIWIEIRIKTYRPKIWLLWWYDAENNVSTSDSFVSFFIVWTTMKVDVHYSYTVSHAWLWLFIHFHHQAPQ